MIRPHLSPWTEAGSLIFVSGQLAFDSSGAISATDIAGQTRQVLKNLESVLRAAGVRLSDVIKTTVWLANAADFPAFNESYAAAFGEVKPARSTVIGSLVLPQALIEIEAIARRSG
jgi:2-iminobutanoate/2-iminopropanoate deaminase